MYPKNYDILEILNVSSISFWHIVYLIFREWGFVPRHQFFLFFWPLACVPFVPILSKVQNILQVELHKCLFFDEISAAKFRFKKFSCSSEVLISFSFTAVWWSPLPLFRGICNFPLTQVFFRFSWFSCSIPFVVSHLLLWAWNIFQRKIPFLYPGCIFCIYIVYIRVSSSFQHLSRYLDIITVHEVVYLFLRFSEFVTFCAFP